MHRHALLLNVMEDSTQIPVFEAASLNPQVPKPRNLAPGRPQLPHAGIRPSLAKRRISPIGSQQPTQNQPHNHFPEPHRTIDEPSTKPQRIAIEPSTKPHQTRESAPPETSRSRISGTKCKKCHTNPPNSIRINTRCKPSNPLKHPSNPPFATVEPMFMLLEPTVSAHGPTDEPNSAPRMNRPSPKTTPPHPTAKNTQSASKPTSSNKTKGNASECKAPKANENPFRTHRSGPKTHSRIP